MQRLHTENHGRQRASQNFRIGKFGALFEIFLIVESDTNTVGHTTASAGTLLSCRLADRLDLQLFHFIAVRVTLHTGQPGINHISDAGNRQRGFGNIGGKHNTATTVGFKDTVLLFNT